MKKRILSFCLAFTLLFGMISVTASAIVQQNPVHKESGTVEGKEDAFPAIRDALSYYQVGQTKTMEKDGYIGIPVDITVYNNPDAFPTYRSLDALDYFWETTEPNPVNLSKTGKPLILYVINTNTVRYGTDSDVNIITDLLSQGYVVMVVDYKNEKRAATPDLDWSLQLVRTTYKTYTGSLDIWKDYNYILPAGYSIKRGVQYFNYIQSGADGTLDYIKEVWNVDLKGTTDAAKGRPDTVIVWGQKELFDGTKVYQDSQGNRCIPHAGGYAYYTQHEDYTYTVGQMVADSETVTPLNKKLTDDAVWENESLHKIKLRYAYAEDFWDCVKKNGERIDFNLYSDICYPTNPKNDVPVMMLASSSELRSSSTQTATRPISTGFMFTGYAFVNYDHAYTPMARTDHYAYFEGEGNRRMVFTLRFHTGVQAQTAAVRQVRALADAYPEIFAFDVNAIGVWGHSKGAAVNILGTQYPEQQPNEAFFPGHNGECSGAQPWLTYTDGTVIPSNVQFVYTSNGGGTSFIYPDNAPTVVTQGEDDGNFTNSTHFNVILNALRALDIPALDMSMEGVGHTTIYGYNKERDYDMYQALFDFADYHLYGKAAVCEYILPTNGTREVRVTDDIIIKFTGSIPESEIREKVKVVNATTGEFVDGIWESAFCRNEWTFQPMGLEGGTIYTVIVPETLIDDNNNAIKARKSISFRTAYDTAFSAAEVVSTNGSFTLVGTEGAKNGVYFVFDAINAANNFASVLRFSVTNKAATALRIFGVSSYNSDTPSASTLTEPICVTGVADSEIIEVDVSEYIASLPVGARPVFYVEAAKSAGTIPLFESDFNEADGRGVFANQTFAVPPEGTDEALRLNMGKSIHVNLFPSNLTEADYGRLITVTFDAYATIDRPLHVRFRLNNENIKLDNGKYFVDLYNDAHAVAYLEAGEWRSVTVTYRIDDYDYVHEDVQKGTLTIMPGGESMSDQYLYVDNIVIAEHIIDATVANKKTNTSIPPTLAIKNANLENAPLAGGGYVSSGKDADKSFGGEDGYLVSGPDGGMTSDDTRVSYFVFNIEQLAITRPYALSLNILSGEGALRAYVIDPSKIPEGFDITKLTYLNAPGLDRSTGDIFKDAMLGCSSIGELDVSEGSQCQFGLTRSLLDLKARGAKTMLVAIVALPERTSGTVSFSVNRGSSVVETTINTLDFNSTSSLTMATRNAQNSYDTKDVYMQGKHTLQEAMTNNGISVSSDVFYGESGQSMKITVPTEGNSNIYKILKLVEGADRAFTTADIGKTFYISFKIYLTVAPESFHVGLASVAVGGDNLDGSNLSKLYQAHTVEGLKANQWNSVEYSFQVTDLMVGERVSAMKNDSRPIHFSIQGLRATDMYVDDFRYYCVEADEEASTAAPSRLENLFESATIKDKVTENGFESYYDELGNKISRITHSATESATKDGTGSLRVLHNKKYNRIFVTNLISADNMIEQNIGDTYTFVFRVKASKAGIILVDVAKKAHSNTDAKGYPAVMECRISQKDVGKWLTFSYDFTLTKSITDDVAGGNNDLFGYRFRFNDAFGVADDGSTDIEFFFDDMVCYRNAIADTGNPLEPDAIATTSQSTLKADNPSVSGSIEGVRKAYFSYDLTNVRDIHRALIALKAREHQGQTFRLYALRDVSFPEELTFNNAPANGSGVKMLLQYAFGGAPLQDFTFDANGEAKIDVTEYILSALGDEVIFAVVSEEGHMCYLNLDFTLVDASVDSFFSSDADCILNDGTLSTNGTSITIHNAFAGTEAILPAHVPVTVRIQVDGNQSFTVKIDGTDFSITKSAEGGIIEFTFTPITDTKAGSITISADEAGFAVRKIEIQQSITNIAVLDTPVLELYTPVAPVYDFEEVIVAHNMIIGESLSYNLYLSKDKGIASIEVDGAKYTFGALSDVTVGTKSLKLLVLNTVAKDAFVSYTVKITLENGESANYEISTRRYLEQLYQVTEKEEEKYLAANMISYLAASAEYFYAEERALANAASAVRDTVLGLDYDKKNAVDLTFAPVTITEPSGMKGAGVELGERPTFYFIAAEGYENETPTFTIDGVNIRYTTQIIGADTYFCLIHSPDMLDKTVSYTIGAHNGSFNLRAYYDWAKAEQDDTLVHLVERLYAYNQSIHACFD